MRSTSAGQLGVGRGAEPQAGRGQVPGQHLQVPRPGAAKRRSRAGVAGAEGGLQPRGRGLVVRRRAPGRRPGRPACAIRSSHSRHRTCPRKPLAPVSSTVRTGAQGLGGHRRGAGQVGRVQEALQAQVRGRGSRRAPGRGWRAKAGGAPAVRARPQDRGTRAWQRAARVQDRRHRHRHAAGLLQQERQGQGADGVAAQVLEAAGGQDPGPARPAPPPPPCAPAPPAARGAVAQGAGAPRCRWLLHAGRRGPPGVRRSAASAGAGRAC